MEEGVRWGWGGDGLVIGRLAEVKDIGVFRGCYLAIFLILEINPNLSQTIYQEF